jgi:hypothetical protein
MSAMLSASVNDCRVQNIHIISFEEIVSYGNELE